MALKKQVKLSLYEKSPWKIKGKNGKTYQGVNYEGFDQNNRVVRFSSPGETYPVFDCSEYVESNARSIALFGRTDVITGNVKWKDYEEEKKVLDKDFSEEDNEGNDPL